MIALSRTDSGSPAGPDRTAAPDSPADSSGKPVQYAYLGPEGTFTEAALLAFDPGAAGHAKPCVSIQATLDAVRSGAGIAVRLVRRLPMQRCNRYQKAAERSRQNSSNGGHARSVAPRKMRLQEAAAWRRTIGSERL